MTHAASTLAGDAERRLQDSPLRKRASTVALGVALVLIAFKLWAWAASGSIALLTSAMDAAVDAAASLVTFAGVRYAERPVDSQHRFGHGKGEAIAAFVQALFLLGAGFALAMQSARRLFDPEPLARIDFGIWVIVGSLIAAVGLVIMQTYVVRRTGSTAIAADRVHYFSDIAVNCAVLAALGLTELTGLSRFDPAFALAISGFILWNGRAIARNALEQLLDRELPARDREAIERAVLSVAGAEGVHDLRTRSSGERLYVEFHLEVDGRLTVEAGHAIADAAERAVERALAKSEALAHVEPAGIDDERLDHQLRRTPATG